MEPALSPQVLTTAHATDRHITPQLQSPQHRLEAARLLYEAFTLKVERLELFPYTAEQAVRLIAKSLNPRCGLYALQAGKVVGVAGLEYDKERFVDISKTTFTEEFGLIGGTGRYLWMRLLKLLDKSSSQVFRVEPLAVSSSMRGQGIGSALLNAAFERARQLGYLEVIIGVVNTNLGAKALYKRHGFKLFKTTHYGFLTKQAGFTSAHMLRKNL